MYKDCGRQALGTAGEEAAARYLTALGYTVLERNYRCGHGEIDIIAERNGRSHLWRSRRGGGTVRKTRGSR